MTAVNTRPVYHITAGDAIHWPFDANGALYWKGRYHLMWILSPPFRWAHASSTDLIHWRMHPRLDNFNLSGKAFVDPQGRPTLVFGYGPAPSVTVARALDDDLDHWEIVPSKHGAEPGDPDPSKFTIWDPCGWYEGEEAYAIFGSHPHLAPPATAWRSPDGMKTWQYIGPLLSHQMPDVEPFEDISCPDLFQLGGKYVLLCIAHVKGARYYIGEFRGGQFHPESHGRMNWPGGACFAPETMEDGQGRRIMWAWATDTHHYRKCQTDLGWGGLLTMPRVLSLGGDGMLHIAPVREYEQLRRNARSIDDLSVAPAEDYVLDGMAGDCLELKVEAAPGSDAPFGVKVRRSPGGEESTAIVYDPRDKVIRIDLARSSLDPEVTYPTYVQSYEGQNGTPVENPAVTKQEAPFALEPGEPLELRVFLDATIMEVFANGRQCLTQRIYPTRADSQGVALWSEDGTARFTRVQAWDMGAIEVVD